MERHSWKRGEREPIPPSAPASIRKLILSYNINVDVYIAYNYKLTFLDGQESNTYILIVHIIP